MKDEDEGGRHDVAGVAARRVEQGLGNKLDWRSTAGHRRIDEAALAARATRRNVGGDGRGGFRYALQGPAVEKEIGRVDIGRDPRLLAPQDLTLGVLGDRENGEDLVAVEGGLGVGDRVAPHLDRDRLIRVQGLHEVAAELRLILIDDGDRHAAKNLTEIGLRIERP